MGQDYWSDDDYNKRASDRRVSGRSAFSYTDHDMKNVDSSQWRAHPQLDPKGVNRESRDSMNHPESLSIAVDFDVTGSMGEVPRSLQRGLPKLMGLFLQRRWVEHPQILFGAIGDATCDRVPLQIGQFESDIAMENDLGRFFLEGNGGGQGMESYELAIYMADRHFIIDCFEKRKKKGYLFLIGDEMPYPYLKADEVRKIIGDNIGEDIKTEKLIRQAKKKYNIFMIRPTHTQWGRNERVQERWISLLGQQYVVQLEYPEAIAETIALITGVAEGKTNLEEGVKEIRSLVETTLPDHIIDSLANSLKVIRPSLKQTAGTENTVTGAKKSSNKGPKIGRI